MTSSSAPSEPPGIVLLGTPRSGTTLLRRILDAHSSIACPPERYLLSAAARFLHEDRFAAGLPIGVLAGLGFSGVDEAEVLDRLRQFVFGFCREHAARQGKSRWAEKTAFDAFHLPALRRLLQGRVQFVCIERHGLDVACSLADLVEKTGGYVDELHAYLRRYPQPLEAFARAWVDTTEAISQLVADDTRAMSVKYESLVADPHTVVRDILAFVGEPWHDGLVERALSTEGHMGFGDWKTYARASIDSASIDRWKALPSPTIGYLAEICNPTLVARGYDPVPTNAEEAEQAKRRYELGLLVNRMKSKSSSTSD